MDDAYDSTLTFDVPTWMWVTSAIEIAACALAVVGCLALLRRGPAALPVVLIAVPGALLAGASTALVLASYRTGRWMLEDRFWELTTYGRAVGLALLGLALVLALLRRPAPGEN